MKLRKPRSVVLRVFVSLTTLGIMVFLLGALAIYAFRKAGAQFDEVANDLLPAMKLSADLGAESVNLASRASDIISVGSTIELNTIRLRYADQLAAIHRIEERLEALDLHPAQLQAISQLVESLSDQLDDLFEQVNLRIQNDIVSETKLNNLLEVSRNLSTLGIDDITKASGNKKSAELWKQQSQTLIERAIYIQNVQHPILIEKRLNEFLNIDRNRQVEFDKINLVLDQSSQGLHEIHSKISKFSELFELQLTNTKMTLAIEGTLNKHHNLSDRLLELVSGFNAEIQDQSEMLSGNIRDRVQFQTTIFSIGFVIMLLIGALVFNDLSKNVIKRIQILSLKIQNSFKKEDDSYLENQDEIGEIENSFTQFSRAIELRESKLKALGAQAEAANLSKSRLLAAASHDLRQPLHAMGLFLSVMERNSNGSVNEKNHRAMTSLVNEMMASFDQILDLSKIELGNQDDHLSHFNLATVFNRIKNEFTLAAQNVGIKLKIESVQKICFSNQEAVYRILSNLVSNSIRYAPNSIVHVGCHNETGTVKISVSDTGPGIQSGKDKAIFKKHVRLSNVPGGKGLGLAIAQDLANGINTKIELSDNKPHGASFAFNVELGNSTAVVEDEPKSTPNFSTKLEGLSVILIDDNEAVLEATSQLLHVWGCDTQTYQEISQVIDELEDIPLESVFIIDLHLGRDRNGFELAQTLEEDGYVCSNIIIISADASEVTIDRIKSSGYRFLRKPVKPGQLGSLLRKVSSGR